MTSAKSSILMEYETGKILYENNAKERLAPASMTKIMSLLLIMEQIDSGKLKLDDEVLISDKAASMGGSQIYLAANTKMKVNELLKGVAIASANDAVVALAEKTYGSVDKFVAKMNEKANELGLINTVFKNPHGLDEEGHYSCSYDMAIMARELIKHERILEYTKIYEEYLNKPDGSKSWLVNTNKLVRFYEGVDGLKTGYTTNALYCLTATAKKNNLRFITVLMGEENADVRTTDTANLLNYAFNSFKLNNLIKKDQVVGAIKDNKTVKNKYNLYTKEDLNDVLEINDEVTYQKPYIDYEDLTYPIKKNTVVAYLKYKTSNNEILSVPLIVKEDIKKANYKDLVFKNFKLFLGIN
ncbi:MAG: D-alanyl-D-alanine carboxypeptidase [Bacilli bacterium]|nr:D-alanyl-D-alanine carboxypeptidase [Bacilli bacterium]